MFCLKDVVYFYLVVQELFADPDNRNFFVSVGRDLISRLLLNAQKVNLFLLTFNNMPYNTKSVQKRTTVYCIT